MSKPAPLFASKFNIARFEFDLTEKQMRWSLFLKKDWKLLKLSKIIFLEYI